MIELTAQVAIAMAFISVVMIILASFRVHDMLEAKRDISRFYIVIDADAEYRILACCVSFRDALEIAKERIDAGISADVIPVDMNTIYG